VGAAGGRRPRPAAPPWLAALPMSEAASTGKVSILGYGNPVVDATVHASREQLAELSLAVGVDHPPLVRAPPSARPRLRFAIAQLMRHAPHVTVHLPGSPRSSSY
jgi:hypothetical protein